MLWRNGVAVRGGIMFESLGIGVDSNGCPGLLFIRELISLAIFAPKKRN
jgi:hypothetical protein